MRQISAVIDLAKPVQCINLAKLDFNSKPYRQHGHIHDNSLRMLKLFQFVGYPLELKAMLSTTIMTLRQHQ